jgi:hypothetical protein
MLSSTPLKTAGYSNGVDMDLLLFYLRKLFSVLKNEVLVLPSRVVVALFFLFLLLLPVFTRDPYLLRIFTLTAFLPYLLRAGISFPALPAR